jgi:ketosteroid isomerase-like protein
MVSRTSLELVRTIYKAWSRGDFSVGEGLVGEDFEWHQFAQAVEPGARRGDAIGDSLRNLFEVYENFRVEPVEFIDAGDKVVVVQRARATGRGSGIELDQPLASVWTVQAETLVRHEVYLSRYDALRAVGLDDTARG